MNIFNSFRDDILGLLEAMAKAGELPAGLDTARVTVEPPRDPAHGDLSTNAAMVLAKPAGMNPRALAEGLRARLAKHESVVSAEIAGPGFLNLWLKDGVWQGSIADILRSGTEYGGSTAGAGKKVNVEYVSANPTGPLHVGHARGAVFGDALAALLEKAGYDVTREYYINDAGAQLQAFARSVYFRYRQALGEKPSAPEDLYPGDYLIPVGQALAERDGRKLLNAERGVWMEACANFGCVAMMNLIKDDLRSLDIVHDEFFSERILHRTAKDVDQVKDYFEDLGIDAHKYFLARDLQDRSPVQAAIDALDAKGLIYTGVLEPPKGRTPEEWEPRPQTLFRASDFGDDVDRPLKKSDDSWTYFAADIAYHYDKYQRGFREMINVWGADHGGYIKRMKAVVKALTDGQGNLDLKICQLVNLTREGEPVKMSKRAGTFVTLREVVEEVGKDVVRFIMLTRKNDAPLDFDLAKVTEQSRDNPVFYVQYAHARCRSVLRHAAAEVAEVDLAPAALGQTAPLERLIDPAEMALIRQMAGFPRLIEIAAEAHEPHRVAFYLYDLASSFHALWNKGKDEASLRFLLPNDPALTRARLALVTAVATVIAAGLAIMGVTPVEEMR